MSTTATKHPLAAAAREAAAFRSLFTPDTFSVWEFAGSMRRRKPEVGDIEHVIIPVWGDAPGAGLFSEKTNLLLRRIDELYRGGVISQAVDAAGRTCWGEKHRKVMHGEFMHDIWLADKENWGSALAIRTGPGTYSRMLVTKLQTNGYMNDGGYVLNKNDMTCTGCGWRGTFAGERGLVFIAPEDWDATTGSTGKMVKPLFVNGRDRGGVCPNCRKQGHLSLARISVPDERSYFQACNVPYAEPWERNKIPQAGGGY